MGNGWLQHLHRLEVSARDAELAWRRAIRRARVKRQRLLAAEQDLRRVIEEELNPAPLFAFVTDEPAGERVLAICEACNRTKVFSGPKIESIVVRMREVGWGISDPYQLMIAEWVFYCPDCWAQDPVRRDRDEFLQLQSME